MEEQLAFAIPRGILTNNCVPLERRIKSLDQQFVKVTDWETGIPSSDVSLQDPSIVTIARVV